MENEDEVVKTSYKRQKRIILIGLAVFWFFGTVAQVFLGKSDAGFAIIFLLTAIGWGVGLMFWYKADSKERDSELSEAFPIAIVALGIFALIYYLFKSRGATGGFKAIGWILLYAIPVFLVIVILATILILLINGVPTVK